MSNLISMVGERESTPRSSTPSPTVPDVLEVTSVTGSRWIIDRRSHTYKQLQVARPLQGIVTPSQYGTYWTLKPDPPVVGSDLVIWGPRPNDDRPHRIDVYELVSVEAIEPDA